MIDFHDVSYAKSRLHNILSYYLDTKHLIYVCSVYSGGRNPVLGGYKVLDSGKLSRDETELHYSDLVQKPIKLGFNPTIGRTNSFVRQPKRVWKAGLYRHNLLGVSYKKMRAAEGFKPQRRETSLSTDVINCIFRGSVENKYTPIEELLAAMEREDGYEGGAFHREFALLKDKKILLLDRFLGEVGVVEEGVPQLNVGYEYLTEKLEEALHEDH